MVTFNNCLHQVFSLTGKCYSSYNILVLGQATILKNSKNCEGMNFKQFHSSSHANYCDKCEIRMSYVVTEKCTRLIVCSKWLLRLLLTPWKRKQNI